MQSICVFCGSNTGANPRYTTEAQNLGKMLAERGIRLVYGAGNIGLMGIIADAALDAGGEVIGVIPYFLKVKEVCHTGLTELYVTKTMHQRKEILADLSDGFIAMPGGFGTMDELCEILTWAQLGLHSHPIGLLNVEGYYDHLIQLFDKMADDKFLHPKNRSLVISDTEPAALLQKMADFSPPDVEKWLDRSRI
jgi:uncharacterized protein (TIGR00730 family)